jgi:hypothetical protein
VAVVARAAFAASDLRIVCTKCMRIVRVKFVLDMMSYRSVAVVTECCTRTYGHIKGRVVEERPKDLTSNDIEPLTRAQLEEQLETTEGYIKQHTELADWVRFVLAGDVA